MQTIDRMHFSFHFIPQVVMVFVVQTEKKKQIFAVGIGEYLCFRVYAKMQPIDDVSRRMYDWLYVCRICSKFQNYYVFRRPCRECTDADTDICSLPHFNTLYCIWSINICSFAFLFNFIYIWNIWIRINCVSAQISASYRHNVSPRTPPPSNQLKCRARMPRAHISIHVLVHSIRTNWRKWHLLRPQSTVFIRLSTISWCRKIQ